MTNNWLGPLRQKSDRLESLSLIKEKVSSLLGKRLEEKQVNQLNR